mgnify:CR=1 FL=1
MESKYGYFKRDISWLSFNHRVLLEADDDSVENIHICLIKLAANKMHYRVQSLHLKFKLIKFDVLTVAERFALRHKPDN